ncbi:unnamed protein product [Arabis nemorensis]|uniref:Flotillin-like n=1 Tax=Arabis nemorensis TaxID=586526 RepID=A0A565BYJ3_9BRAS|nr:unnamed protein product [Arabis nemorensis]
MEATNKAKAAEIGVESKIISTKRLGEGTKEEIKKQAEAMRAAADVAFYSKQNDAEELMANTEGFVT